jgi:hydroxypyruvate isomerase
MTAHPVRYDINLSILFTELPLLERSAAAAAAGFDAVEFWWPFDRAVPDGSEVDRFATAVEDAGACSWSG